MYRDLSPHRVCLRHAEWKRLVHTRTGTPVVICVACAAESARYAEYRAKLNNAFEVDCAIQRGCESVGIGYTFPPPNTDV